MKDLSHVINVESLRKVAKRRLPQNVFDYMDGGADGEWTLRRNGAAFLEYELLPLHLVDVESIDLRVSCLGVELQFPVLLSPIGMGGLFHPEKEQGAARAAAKFGTIYCLSTMGTSSIEDVAVCTRAPKIFQLYCMRDRGLTAELVERCKEAKYQAICITVDTPVAGNRERDRASAPLVPPRWSIRSAVNFASHPVWSWNLLKRPGFVSGSLPRYGFQRNSEPGESVMSVIDTQFAKTTTWKDVEWLAGIWGGPIVLKGIQSVRDAVAARDVGVSAIMISNHGGRQLDCVPATIDVIEPIREAVGDGIELIADGGIRRGTDIIKAIALGADACSVGRAYLYGLAAYGQRGVERALAILRAELERGLALLGCNRIADINTGMIRKVAQVRHWPSSPQSRPAVPWRRHTGL